MFVSRCLPSEEDVLLSFGPFVKLFEVDGIPIIGNVDSGAMAGLTSAAAQCCRSVLDGEMGGEAIASVDSNLFSYLQRSGFFEEDWRYRHPTSAYVHVTQRCNLNCRGCYSMSSLRNNIEDPSVEKLRVAFGELSRNGVESINISGGEPFLRDDLCEIVGIAHDECGIPSVNVVTNGTVAGSFDLRELAKSVACVTVSIDGSSSRSIAYIRGQQRFDVLVHMVEDLKESGIRTRILPTLHAKNIDEFSAYLALAAELQVELNFSLLSFPPDRRGIAELIPDKKKLEELACKQGARLDLTREAGPFGINMQVKETCGAGCRNLSVDVDGGLYPCHMLQAGEFLMGNIFEEQLSEILDRSADRVNAWFPHVEAIDGCATCDFNFVCGGGCRARAINLGAGPLGEDPYCALSKGYYTKLFSALSDGASN